MNDEMIYEIRQLRFREVTGSNPFEILNFSGFHTQLQKLRS